MTGKTLEQVVLETGLEYRWRKMGLGGDLSRDQTNDR
jgi:hypothetical protein